MKIFLIEDDYVLAELLKGSLEKYGFDVVIAKQFHCLVDECKRIDPNLLLMDIHLPYYDGFYWTKEIRRDSNVPIIFLSARDQTMDQVMAMEYGGDDYLVKPVDHQILIAKIKSQLRRTYGAYAVQKERILSYQKLDYLPERLEIRYHERRELLTKKEGELMELLVQQAPKIIKRENFLIKLWDDQQFVDDNTLSVNMTRLRKKMEDIGLPNAIKTIRNQGYQLDWSGKS